MSNPRKAQDMKRNDAQRIIDNPADFTAADYAEAWRAINLPGERKYHGLRTGDMMQIDDDQSWRKSFYAIEARVSWFLTWLGAVMFGAALLYTLWAMLP